MDVFFRAGIYIYIYFAGVFFERRKKITIINMCCVEPGNTGDVKTNPNYHVPTIFTL